jgi:hypothetical protein
MSDDAESAFLKYFGTDLMRHLFVLALELAAFADSIIRDKEK